MIDVFFTDKSLKLKTLSDVKKTDKSLTNEHNTISYIKSQVIIKSPNLMGVHADCGSMVIVRCCFLTVITSLHIHVRLLFGVLRPTREFFTHLESSPFPVKGLKF